MQKRLQVNGFGRRDRYERSVMNGRELETFSEFKYLGFVLIKSIGCRWSGILKESGE